MEGAVTRRYAVVLVSLALLVLIGSGCRNPLRPQYPSGTTGALRITIDGTSLPARTLLPAISMEPASYALDGVGPGGAGFAETVQPGDTLTVESVAVGQWSISVIARNVSGDAIGTGSAEVSIQPNVTNPVSVTVTPYDGLGTLNLTVNWNDTGMAAPRIHSTLSPAAGAVRTLDFAVDSVNRTATWSADDVPTGYHTLVVQLLDDDELVSGIMRVVRIVDAQTTIGVFDLEQMDFSQGRLLVEIAPQMNDPLDVVILGSAPEKPVSGTLDLTASVTNHAGNSQYVWYVNGAYQSVGQSYRFDGTWPVRYYNIDVAVYSADGTRAGSAGSFVRVTEGDLGPFSGSVESANLDVAGSRITRTTAEMEYSVDGGFAWADCVDGFTSAAFGIGDEVHIRFRYAPDTARYLGRVDATQGHDFVPEDVTIGTGWFTKINSALPGDTVSLVSTVRNLGNLDVVSGQARLQFYLTRDHVDGPDKVVVGEVDRYLTIRVDQRVQWVGAPDSFEIPTDIDPGVWYAGVCIINTSLELTTGNNCTIPQAQDQIVILGGDASGGAFKLVNSWGTGGWENVPDGHYWLDFDTVKSLRLVIRYYHNNFSAVYEPRVLAVFDVEHDRRDQALIRIGVGDPAVPIAVKKFQSDWSSNESWAAGVLSGSHPFPATEMSVDISEFAGVINRHNVFVELENRSSSAGTVHGLRIEFYSDFGSGPFKTIIGGDGTFSGESTSVFSVATAGSLTTEQEILITPLDRMSAQQTLYEERPTPEELTRAIGLEGVFEPRNYNVISSHGFGTGYAPPTEEEWQTALTLRSVASLLDRGWLPDSADHSATPYFPPIGNQGSKGSCTAFAVGYYIQTYIEAKERGWDLSAAAWDNSGGWPGAPVAAYRDRIMSPDFMYHQINSGVDGGSSAGHAADLVVRIGGAPWELMPYNVADSSSWPSAEAFREAGRYRGRHVYTFYTPRTGFFVVEDDSGIELLRSLLAAGYVVSTSVRANELYGLLDQNDVLVGYDGGPMSTNHANVIVGYKSGSAWDPASPDG